MVVLTSEVEMVAQRCWRYQEMSPTVYGHDDTVADALHNNRPSDESKQDDQQVPPHIIAMGQQLGRSSLQ